MAVIRYKSKAELFYPCESCPLNPAYEDRGQSVLSTIGWAVLRLKKSLQEDEQWENDTTPNERAAEIVLQCDLNEDYDDLTGSLLSCAQRQFLPREIKEVDPNESYL